MSDLHPVFVRAKEILLTRGWHCGAARGPNLEPCIIIACADAYEEIYRLRVVRGDILGDDLEVHRILGEIIGTKSVPTWNDYPSRTFEEVIAVLDQAIFFTAPVMELVGSC